ncbi:hypothetical protein WMY93_011985 [Mugilogobius chulae]|uniref:Uncharacterized protein n=1 Tax=Mugilogobius chulae TaxID=88201 RepID=A0AAW0PD01_9GOBI
MEQRRGTVSTGVASHINSSSRLFKVDCKRLFKKKSKGRRSEKRSSADGAAELSTLLLTLVQNKLLSQTRHRSTHAHDVTVSQSQSSARPGLLGLQPIPAHQTLPKQLEKFEWQLRTLKEVVSAHGNAARAELLKGHAHEEVCALVNSLLDKVKTETTADLNVLFEQKSKAASDEHERQVEELQKTHKEEMAQLTEKFEAAENLLKDRVEKLTSELQIYNQLKRRVQESTLKRDLKRNIQTQKNQCLEEQLVHVLQQNEDLRVRFDNCQSFIQQLTKEQGELKLTLDRQLSINQRLSQEKEELVFKIRHRDSYPSMHLSAMVPEIAHGDPRPTPPLANHRQDCCLYGRSFHSIITKDTSVDGGSSEAQTGNANCKMSTFLTRVGSLNMENPVRVFLEAHNSI